MIVYNVPTNELRVDDQVVLDDGTPSCAFVSKIGRKLVHFEDRIYAYSYGGYFEPARLDDPRTYTVQRNV